MCQSRMAIWVSEEECVTLDEIKQAISEDRYNQIKIWRDSINREKKGDLAKLDAVVCRIVDGIFRNIFITTPKKSTTVVSQDFMGSNIDAKQVWAKYCSEIIPALQMAQSKGQLPRGFAARTTLDLCWLPESTQPLPFLTESVIKGFFAVLQPVKDTITEVSNTSYCYNAVDQISQK